jgi:hypothetical protein
MDRAALLTRAAAVELGSPALGLPLVGKRVAANSKERFEDRTKGMEQDLRSALRECREQLERVEKLLRQCRSKDSG